MRICGPKLSLCGLIISIWGIIQLVSETNFLRIMKYFLYTKKTSFQVLMGVFYYIHSVALVEDLPLEEHYRSVEEFYTAADRAYQQVRKVASVKLLRSSDPDDSPIVYFRTPTTAGSPLASMLLHWSSQDSNSTPTAARLSTKHTYIYILSIVKILCL